MSIKHQNPRASSRVRKREAEAEQKEREEGRRTGAWGGEGGEGGAIVFLSLYTNSIRRMKIVTLLKNIFNSFPSVIICI